MLKRIIVFLIVSLLPAGLTLAQEKYIEETVYVRDETGAYRRADTFALQGESYAEAWIYLPGHHLYDEICSVIASTISEKRLRKLIGCQIDITIHFNAIRKRFVYVSFRCYKKGKNDSMPLTNREMTIIEAALRHKEYEYTKGLGSVVPYFSSLSYGIRPREILSKFCNRRR